MIGWERRLDQENAAIVVPAGTKVSVDAEWVTLFAWDKLPTGPTIFEVELAAKLGAVRPTDIQSRWLRPGNNKTKRHAHPVGTIESWASVTTYLEYISETGDVPFRFQLWAKGGGMTIVKVIPKYLNPAAYIADRIGSKVSP